jgi:hypothetical protein
MDADLRRQLGVRDEGDHRLLGEGKPLVDGRHRGLDVGG